MSRCMRLARLAVIFAVALGIPVWGLAQTQATVGGPRPAAAGPVGPVGADDANDADDGARLSQAALNAALGTEKAARTEAVIHRLHGDLKITPDQEAGWQDFAGTMRQNAVRMDRAAMKRDPSPGTPSAVQSLESYGAFEQTSASNFAHLLPPFRALYDQFSPGQKLIADRIFLRHFGKAMTEAR